MSRCIVGSIFFLKSLDFFFGRILKSLDHKEHLFKTWNWGFFLDHYIPWATELFVYGFVGLIYVYPCNISDFQFTPCKKNK